MDFYNFDVNNIVRNEIKGIVRQNSKSERSLFLRMDKNENLFELDIINENALKDLVTSNLISSYPNFDKIYSRISTFFGAETENIILTAGADAAIKSVYETFVNNGDLVILPEYSYGMHQVYINQFGAREKRINFENNLTLSLRQIENINKKIKLVFLESPSGSSGVSMKAEDIQSFAKKLIRSDTLLIVDETYSPIVSNYLPYSIFQNNLNLISIRSFSKNIGLAGLRTGFIMANKLTISWIRRIKPMYEINSFAASVLDFYFTKIDLFVQYKEQIATSRLTIENKLNKIEFQLILGEANFFLLKPRYKKSILLYDFLQNNGILIRDQFQTGSLKGFFRITFSNKIMTNKLLNLLDEYASLPTIEI